MKEKNVYPTFFKVEEEKMYIQHSKLRKMRFVTGIPVEIQKNHILVKHWVLHFKKMEDGLKSKSVILGGRKVIFAYFQKRKKKNESLSNFDFSSL